MSQVNTNSIYDASGGSNAVLYGVAAPANSMGNRNRIINGDMRIDQRNAGASVTPAALEYQIDRWRYFASQASKITMGQNQGSVTPPAGFTNYLGLTSSSAYSVLAADFFGYQQFIEGLNASDLAWGTANAQAVTLSFWVRSSLTGTFGGSIQNSGTNRSYPFSYTINAANTWEQKTVTIPGDTSGTWLTTNGRGIAVNLMIGVGSNNSGTAGAWAGADYRSATGATSVVGTSGATFYITGVQLEAGSVASPFERRDYGRELMMCQRYFQKYVGISGGYASFGCGRQTSTTASRLSATYPTMRAVPTLSYAGNIAMDMPSAGPAVTSLGSQYLSSSSGFFDVNHNSGGAVGYGVFLQIQTSSSDFVALSAEL